MEPFAKAIRAGCPGRYRSVGRTGSRDLTLATRRWDCIHSCVIVVATPCSKRTLRTTRAAPWGLSLSRGRGSRVRVALLPRLPAYARPTPRRLSGRVVDGGDPFAASGFQYEGRRPEFPCRPSAKVSRSEARPRPAGAREPGPSVGSPPAPSDPGYAVARIPETL